MADTTTPDQTQSAYTRARALGWKLDELRPALQESCMLTTKGWPGNQWHVQVWSDSKLELYVADLYASISTTLLKTRHVDIVVNMVGKVDERNDDAGIYGPGWHFQSDARGWQFNDNLNPDLNADMQRYQADQTGFYDQLGIHCIVHGIADRFWHSVREHIRVVLAKVQQVQMAIRENSDDSGKKMVVWVHCYAGWNRSGIMATAILYHHLRGTADAKTMEQTIEYMVQKHPYCLSKKGWSHIQFLQDLLEHEADLGTEVN